MAKQIHFDIHLVSPFTSVAEKATCQLDTDQFFVHSTCSSTTNSSPFPLRIRRLLKLIPSSITASHLQQPPYTLGKLTSIKTDAFHRHTQFRFHCHHRPLTGMGVATFYRNQPHPTGCGRPNTTIPALDPEDCVFGPPHYRCLTRQIRSTPP